MNKPIRVAQIMGKMEKGGVESVIMNYYRHMDRDKVQFDFFVDSDSNCPQEEEIKALGGRVYKISPYQHITKNLGDMKKIFRKNKYQIVHSNLTTMSVFSLFEAKRCGVPVRICHGHSTSCKGDVKRNIMKNVLKPFSKLFATEYFACSKYAGKYLFGNRAFKKGEVNVVSNAIDADKFKYNKFVHDEMRKKLGIEDKFVIGHVGRFVYPKNHSFLIDIFNEIHKRNKDSVLVLVGEGPLEKEAKRKVHAMNLDDCVLFLGAHNDIEKYYQAFDAFVLPSFYEGMPVVGIESQAAGLPCVYSDAVTKDVKLLDTTKMLNINSSAKHWAKCILAQHSPVDRDKSVNIVKKEGFDIVSEAKKLQNFYLNAGNF